VIDLTATANRTKYYDPSSWIGSGIRYEWIKCEGHVTPAPTILMNFCNIVNKFLYDNPSKLVGVHCTHGLNRTGYFICSFMVLVMQILPHVALKSFSEARGYEIERKNYISSIISHDKNLELKKFLAGRVENLKRRMPKEKELSCKRMKLHGLSDEVKIPENEEQQEKLKNCIDISGFDKKLLNSTKSLKEVASDILNDHKISHDISSILDVQKHQTKSILTVTFSSYDEKMRIMKLKKDFHKTKKFAIFHHTLTHTNKVLLGEAKKICSRMKLRVNIIHGKIIVHNRKGNSQVQIKSADDLKRILENEGLRKAAEPSSSTS
jgi:hypothetical protein